MNHSNTAKAALFGILLVASGSTCSAVVGWGAATNNSTASNCPSNGLCTTANNGDFAYNSDGGDGSSSATSKEITYGTSEALATLSGTSFLPTLKAFSGSLTGAGAFASATGVQGYTYAGPATTITLDLNLDVTINDGDDGRAEAAAQVAVIFTDNLGFYTDFGTVVFEAAPPNSVSGSSQLSASSSLNTLTDTITFDVVPGDEFLIWAGLQTKAWRGGVADAFSTFTMDFFDAQGNPLDIGSSAASIANPNPVPLPAAIWLFGSGLLGLIGIARRTPRAFPRKV